MATILLRFEGGARGSVAISQLSPGRKNSLQYEIDGSSAAVAWDSEQPEQLWIGHRDRPNELLLRNPALMNELGGAAAAAARWTRRRLRRHVRSAVHGNLRGRPRRAGPRRRRDTPPSRTVTTRCWSATRSPRAPGRGPVGRPTRPASAAPRVPASVDSSRRHGGLASMKLGFLTAPFPETPLMDVADWAAGAGFEVLEIACWPKATGPPALRRHEPHRRHEPVRRPGHRDRRRARLEGPLDLGPRLLSQPAPPGPRAPRRGHRPPQAGHHGRAEDGRARS